MTQKLTKLEKARKRALKEAVNLAGYDDLHINESSFNIGFDAHHLITQEQIEPLLKALQKIINRDDGEMIYPEGPNIAREALKNHEAQWGEKK